MRTLIVICWAALLFTSCEKEEMGVGGTGGGGGKEDANLSTKSTLSQEDSESTLVLDTILTVDEDLDRQ